MGKASNFDELQDLISTPGRLRREMKEIIDFKKDVNVVLIEASPEKSQVAVIELVRILVKERGPGIYVSGDIPAKDMQKKLKDSGISTKNILFIDFATRLTTQKQEANCLYAGGPKEITALGILFAKAIAMLPEKEKCFLVFDSLSVLLAYHDRTEVERFAHTLAAEIRKKKKLSGFVLAVEEDENQQLLAKTAKYFDATASLK